LVLVLVLSLVVLIRQAPAWAGAEIAFVDVFYIAAVGASQLSAYRRTGSLPRKSLYRAGLGYLLALVGLIGGYNLYSETGPGLYLIALQVIAIIVWNLRNAWFLLMGVVDEDLAKAPTART
jgi:hypothetical protein